MGEDPKHREMERKYRADDVDVQAFLKWGIQKNRVRYLHTFSPDVYYRCGKKGVVRHRWASVDSQEAGQLTSKRRKSMEDTEYRSEVDLDFAPGTTNVDVQQFLRLMGAKRVLTVLKSSDIFTFVPAMETLEVTVALYDVWETGRSVPPEKQRFLEVEVEKSGGASSAEASRLLADFERQLKRDVPIGKREKLSLYELFTGKKYPMDRGTA